jgi:hypothetical protein
MQKIAHHHSPCKCSPVAWLMHRDYRLDHEPSLDLVVKAGRASTLWRTRRMQPDTRRQFETFRTRSGSQVLWLSSPLLLIVQLHWVFPASFCGLRSHDSLVSFISRASPDGVSACYDILAQQVSYSASRFAVLGRPRHSLFAKYVEQQRLHRYPTT